MACARRYNILRRANNRITNGGGYILTQHENSPGGYYRCRLDPRRKCIYETKDNFEYFGGERNCPMCMTHNKIKDRNKSAYREKVYGRKVI